jgi:hypothetical protein
MGCYPNAERVGEANRELNSALEGTKGTQYSACWSQCVQTSSISLEPFEKEEIDKIE